MLNIGVVVSLIKSLAPGVNPEVIEQAVSDWLDEHPEATTTVEDGSITEQKLATELATKLSNMDGDVTQLKSAIQGDEVKEKLLTGDIPGTTKTVTMDSDGNPVSIVHSNGNEAVRTDAFVWGENTVTETRTLASGKYITIQTNLITLETVVSAVQEVA